MVSLNILQGKKILFQLRSGICSLLQTFQNDPNLIFSIYSFQVHKTFAFKENMLLKVKIQLRANGSFVMLRPRCYGSPCRLSLLYDDVQKIRKNSGYFDIGDSTYNNSDGEFRAFPSNMDNNVLLEIRQIKGNVSADRNSSNRVNFTMELFITGCFYWNETEDTWSSDGCKVRGFNLIRTNVNHMYCFRGEATPILDLTGYAAQQSVLLR